MRHVGLIPLKTHSATIPNKNRKKMLGRPLFCWILTEAIYSKLDLVVVATNDEWITNFIATHYKWTDKVKVINRSKASEEGSLENAAIEFLENTSEQFDSLSLLLATNPFTRSKDINKCLEAIVDGNSSAVTVANTLNSIWNSNGEALNDNEGFQVENSGVFSTTVNNLKNNKSLLTGTVATVEMPKHATATLSNFNDWQLAELSLANLLISNKENKKIKYLVLDVDGVFTDGGVYYDENGEMAKRFDMRDGMGLEIMREQNIQVVIMTSEDSKLVRKRMEKLKLKHLFLGAKDKYSLLENFIQTQQISRSEIAYVGDDVNDLANLCSVGWSFAPKNATNQVLPLVDVVLSKDSGNGAIREATEFLLQYNNRQFKA
ncbi:MULTISPECIES: cytidylyltransferase domain-containing protein [Croceibacter]|uniref:cytidylyltransferase domain-containing protein n=1 Tax=Croceibacter TaxID=216431 RepID=UPI000C3538A3|nr:MULTISPECIES: HAD hydrolase family protein [Croceibacter]MBG26825.1 cytidyltransferase [Croceibacter sp.]|tara:strand:- start:19442 stop:20569 length:1128 start_codon:yes stop_codon:yes gene_type:complete